MNARHRLSRQITALLLMAIVPVSSALFFQAMDRRNAALERGGEVALRESEALLADTRAVIESIEETLTYIVNSPSIREEDWGACSDMLARLHGAHDRAAFIGVVNEAGNVVCSSLPTSRTATVADRTWFNNVRQAMAFSIGDYAIGRTSGQASIHMAYPVVGDSQFRGAANYALDVEWLAKRLVDRVPDLPAAVYVLDQNGRVVATSDDSGPQRGTHAAFLPLMQWKSEGAKEFETLAINGVPRLVRLQPLIAVEGGELWSAVALEKARLTAPAERSFVWALAILVVALGLTIAALWAGLSRLVVRPIVSLHEAAEGLGRGEAAPSIAMLTPKNEVDDLVLAFSRMAEEVAARERDRKQLKLKEKLLQEVSHRVKNHLAVIASMAQIESRQAEQVSKQGLLAMHARILAIASLYDILAKGAQNDLTRLTDYVSQVCDNLEKVIGNADISWHTQFVGDTWINGEQALHVGLFLNEVVSNSIKHAFPSGKGIISVALDASDEGVLIQVSDDGVGRPEDSPGSGLGTTIIRSAVNQLDGDLNVKDNSGTTYILNFRPCQKTTQSSAQLGGDEAS